MRSSRRGLSLLEALFGMLISFMVLGAVTFVLQQSVATGGSLDEQGTLSEVEHAFSLLRRDLAGAFVVEEPASAEVPRVELKFVDPELSFANRIADNLPFEDVEQVKISYRWADGVLTRQLQRGATVADTQRILACASFAASRDGTLITVRLGLVLKKTNRSYTMECRVR